MDTKQWLDRVTDGASVNAVAREAEVPHKTLDTQMRSAAGLKPDMVVRIARKYRYSPVAALIEFGLITESEARDAARLKDGLHAMKVEEVLHDASDGQLLREIEHRLETRASDGSAEDVRPPSRGHGKRHRVDPQP